MFTTQFYVNDTLVDLLHSTVTDKELTQSVEPKILKVLALLAEHQGEVVTHEVIKQAIWPNVEVVPNALQRCIAQLRKMLGDDAKRQAVIVTHPKIGYRLVATVKPVEQQVSQQESLGKKATGFSLNKLWFVLAALLVVSIVVWHNQTPSLSSKFDQIKELTQSEENDLFPIYSPDGQYLVFTRMIGTCQSQIWAKNIASGKESKLTQQEAVYTAPSFSPDGSQIYTTVQDSCSQDEAVNACWSIQTVDFAQALNTPSQLSTVYSCNEHLIELAHGLGNNKVAFLKYLNDRYQLLQVDSRTQAEHTLYRDDEKRIYHFDYHAKSETFAVFARDKHHNDWLTLLDKAGQVKAQVAIERPKQSGTYHFVEPEFTASGEQLIYANNSGTFMLNLNGKTQSITLAEKGVTMVTASPDLSNLVAVRGHVDTDIALINIQDDTSWTSVQGSFNQEFQPYKSLFRTTAVDRQAKFQPNGDWIAYISDQNGVEQVWLTNHEQTYPLSKFSAGAELTSLAWSPEGNRIAVSMNDRLVVLALDGSRQTYSIQVPVRYVVDWPQTDKILITANDTKVRELFAVDVTTSELTSFGIGNVENAALRDNLLYVLDRSDQLRQFTMFNEQLAAPIVLAEHVDVAVFANNAVYWTNHKTRQLLSKDYQQTKINHRMTLKSKTTFITDVKGDNLLTTQIISARKELVKVW